MFLVAGGYDFSDLLSSTETLVEGGQAWNFQQSLPSERYGLRGISLPDTVIMTGKKVLTFTFNSQTQLIIARDTGCPTIGDMKVKLHNFLIFRASRTVLWYT